MTDRDATIREIARDISGEAWTSDRAYQNLLRLCDDIGHRFGGSDSEHRAADFLQGRLREYGLEGVYRERFPVYSWTRGSCLLAMTSPIEQSFTAIAMPYSGSAEIEGELIDVGEGEAPDFERLGAAIRGKIVLTDAETNQPGEIKSHRTDKFRRAVEHGASACVFVNRNPGLLHITGALYARVPRSTRLEDHQARIPGIGISYEAGAAIRRQARRGAPGTPRLRVRVENSVFRSHSFNIVGEIRGAAGADEYILLGAHYDGHDISQGATDNAAGTVVALEAGRLLAPYAGTPRRHIRVVLFGCEEIGLLGSWHHADQWEYGLREGRPRLMLNLDGAGRGAGGQEVVTATADPALQAYFDQLAARHGLTYQTRCNLSVHSDHFPFFMTGIASATLTSQDATAGMIGRGWGHTEADTVDKVSPRGLQSAAALVARLALALASDDEIPVRRLSNLEVRQTLERLGMTSVLKQHWGRDNRV